MIYETISEWETFLRYTKEIMELSEVSILVYYEAIRGLLYKTYLESYNAFKILHTSRKVRLLQ